MISEEEGDVNSFHVTKYRLPNGDYKEWLEHFCLHYRRILRRLGVRDLYAELEDHGGDVTFGQQATYISKPEEAPF